MQYFFRNNVLLEDRVNYFFSYLNDYNKTHFNGALSIILVGSLSRGEGTWTIDDDGEYQILSDIEFFTVYPEGFTAFDCFNKCISEARYKAFNGQKYELFHIDNTFTPISRMKNCGRKLIIFDTKSFGKCLVGSDVLSLLPEIDIHNVVLDDIWDIMVHRAFSVLFYGIKMKKNNDYLGYRYSIAKNSLDLMTIILAKNGILISGFKNRYDSLKTEYVSKKYISYLYYCLNIKLGIEQNVEYEIDRMEELFVELLLSCMNEFKIPLKNRLVNFRFLFHNFLGVLRRVIVYKHIPCSRKKHLKSLIQELKTTQILQEKDIRNNLVLYAYPKT